MIWIKQHENLIGYVPQLTKHYTIDELRNMCLGNTIPEIAQLIMQIQGISSVFCDEEGDCLCYAPNRVIDISFNFFFFTKEELKNQTVKDAFSKMIFYKVIELKISNEEKIRDFLENVLSIPIINVKIQLQDLLELAETNEEILKNYDLPLVFGNADESLLEKFYTIRKVEFIKFF